MMTLIRGDALDSQIPARTYIRRCTRFGDRTVPFLVRSGDRTVLNLGSFANWHRGTRDAE